MLSLALVPTFLYFALFPPFANIASEYAKEVNSELIYLKHPTSYTNYETEPGLREVPIRIWSPKTQTDAALPVFLFSPGSFGIDLSNLHLFESLASEGYLVMSLSHPYHSFSAKLSDGRDISTDWNFLADVLNQNRGLTHTDRLRNFNKWQNLRIEDIEYLLDEILAGNLPESITKRLDTSNIFLSGHSLGGAAALTLGRTRANILRGLVALEAPFFGDITGTSGQAFTFVEEEYPLPVLHFYSDALWDKLNSLEGTEYNTNTKHHKLHSAKYKDVHVEGAGHLGLTDFRLFSPFLCDILDGGKNTADYATVRKLIQEETLAFLNQHIQ